MLRLHEAIPVLTLPGAADGRVSTWDYKHDRALVLLFAEDRDVMRDFGRRHEAYRAANAEVLAVVTQTPAERFPYPVMIDADGSATRRCVDATPAVLVTDAYGVLEGRFDGRDADHDAILELISVVEMRCPECGVPEWPHDDG